VTIPLHYLHQRVQIAQGNVQIAQNQAQIHQLAMMNWHMQQQQAAQAYQANLQQALFDTELRARRVGSTVRHDVFAAAVLAMDWLRRVDGIGPNSFPELGAKRAWAEAWTVLDGAVRAGRTDTRVGAEVDAYMSGMDRLSHYHNALGASPHGLIARADAYAESVDPKIAKIVAAVIAGIAFLLLLPDAFRPLGVLLLIAAGGAAYYSFERNQKWLAATREAARLRHLAAEAAAFRASDAGRFLEHAWAGHPLLFNEPAPDSRVSRPEVSVQIHSERQVVERQIVVVRCKFCRNLAPVDRPTCEHCGAAGFGSAQA
jgi:hypothetical protein